LTTFQWTQYVSTNSVSKMQIYEYQNCSQNSPILLFQTSFTPTIEFLDYYSPWDWSWNEPTLDDPNKCFELRVVTKDACGEKTRNFFFHRGSGDINLPHNPALRLAQNKIDFRLSGNPS